MKASLLRMLPGHRPRPDDGRLSEYELEMAIRKRLYGVRGASLDATPMTTGSRRRARPR